MAANAASGSGCSAASVPPAMTTSARPERIISNPRAIASAPEEQALTGAWAPALAPNSRARAPAGPLGMSMGMHNGLTSREPLVRSVSQASMRVEIPPMPLDTETPSRSGSTPGRPASDHASRAAARAN